MPLVFYQACDNWSFSSHKHKFLFFFITALALCILHTCPILCNHAISKFHYFCSLSLLVSINLFPCPQRLSSGFDLPGAQGIGFLYFSLVIPLGGHGNTPGKVQYQEFRIKRSGKHPYHPFLGKAFLCTKKQSLHWILRDIQGSFLTTDLFHDDKSSFGCNDSFATI